MAAVITHDYTSAIADGGDATLVQPSDWNANHTITGTLTSTQLDLTMTPTWTGAHTFSTSVTVSTSFRLGAGAVVSFDGDVTVTHSTNNIAFAGGSGYSFDNGIDLGSVECRSVEGVEVTFHQLRFALFDASEALFFSFLLLRRCGCVRIVLR